METASEDRIEAESTEYDGEEGAAQQHRIEVKNCPRTFGTKQFKAVLLRNGILSKKIIVRREHCFFTVGTHEEQHSAIDKLNKLEWKGKRLRATVNLVSAGGSKKKNKIRKQMEVSGTELDMEALMLKAVTPLHSVPYEQQLEKKQQESDGVLKDVFKQLAKANRQKPRPTNDVLRPITAASCRTAYRNKCEFSIGRSPDGSVECGFQCSDSVVVAPTRCVHIPETMKSCVAVFRDFLATSNLAPFDGKTNEGYWRMLSLRYHPPDLMMIVTIHPQQLTEEELTALKKLLVDTFLRSETMELGFKVTSLFFQIQTKTSDIEPCEHLGGAPYIYCTLFSSLRFRISPTAFFQTNTVGAELLYTQIKEMCALDKDCGLVDLCCGTGTIGISLAAEVRCVVGVESVRAAVKDAEANAVSNSLDNCRFVCGKVESVFFEIRHYMPPDLKHLVGILDPPRAGVHDKLIVAIRANPALQTLVYVSCDPRQASKNFLDLCRTTSNKYAGVPFALRSVVPVDMFPQTNHFEWVMLFQRE